MTDRFGVVLLSAGSGSRMKSDIPKQYIEIEGKPVLYYSLKQFELNSNIERIVIVVSGNDINMVKESIVDKYSFTKVVDVVVGGKERYNSVYNGLQALGDVDYVMIHDGARPCISEKVINRLACNVKEYKACIPVVASKDTVRIADEEGFVKMTPDRKCVYNVQTPQTFEMKGIVDAFDKYMSSGEYESVNITDDAMVWEIGSDIPIKLVESEYCNIKITTPEDLEFVKRIIKTDN